MTPEQVLDIYRKTGAPLTGHFLLSSGLHSEQYLQSALVLQEPDVATRLCAALAEYFQGERIEVVIAPALGGVFVSHETARALGVRALFAERVNGELTLRRGFTIKPGERVAMRRISSSCTAGGAAFTRRSPAGVRRISSLRPSSLETSFCTSFFSWSLRTTTDTELWSVAVRSAISPRLMPGWSWRVWRTNSCAALNPNCFSQDTDARRRSRTMARSAWRIRRVVRSWFEVFGWDPI